MIIFITILISFGLGFSTGYNKSKKKYMRIEKEMEECMSFYEDDEKNIQE